MPFQCLIYTPGITEHQIQDVYAFSQTHKYTHTHTAHGFIPFIMKARRNYMVYISFGSHIIQLMSKDITKSWGSTKNTFRKMIDQILEIITIHQKKNHSIPSLKTPSENETSWMENIIWKKFKCQTFPNLWLFNLQYFYFMMVWKQYVFSRNCTLNFEFWYFPRQATCGATLFHDCGLQHVAAHGQLHDHEGQQLIHLQPFCTHTTILAFSIVFNKLHETFNTLL